MHGLGGCSTQERGKVYLHPVIHIDLDKRIGAGDGRIRRRTRDRTGKAYVHAIRFRTRRQGRRAGTRVAVQSGILAGSRSCIAATVESRSSSEPSQRTSAIGL